MTDAVAGKCSLKEVFSKLQQISQENVCVGVSFLIKLQLDAPTLSKKRPWHSHFLVKFADCNFIKNQT